MATLATARPISNIAVAFAAQSASNNIPIQREAFDGTGAGSDHRAMLLTPPNSISPTLPAHKHRSEIRTKELPPLHLQGDSDIDLQDAVEHAAAQDLPSSALSREALAGLEAAGQITAAMLAKHHLPGIFQGHGSMPVRDIMAHLAQSVPGYARIPPAKARRLVVAALEHRAGGGLHGEVKFEKVGWGRWHVKSSHGMPIDHASRPGLTPPASVDSARGLMIPRMHQERDMYVGSWAAGSMQSRDEEMADKMSLDGSEASSDSDASDMDLENDVDDQTDEEDWSALGPDSFRGTSYNHRARRDRIDYNYLSRTSGVRFRTPSTTSHSAPFTRPQLAGRATTPASHGHSSTFASRFNTGNNPAFASSIGVLDSRSEREAIEALVAMGSM